MRTKLITGLIIGSIMWGPLKGQFQSKSFSTAGFYSVDNSPRKVFNFNPGWRFIKGDVEGAHEKDFDDSQWEAAHIPHGLEILGENASGGRNYQGIAWYRKRFDIDNGSPDRKYLYFEAVMGHCEVWINGQKVTEHFGGYLPFAVDITDVVNKDGLNNIVAVRADNSDDNLYPPGKPQGNLDFTYLGGIYRDVYLIKTNPVHVTFPELSKTVAGGGVFFATLDINDKEALLEARTEVINHSNTSQKLIIKTTLEDSEGKTIQTISQDVTLKPGKTKQLSKRFVAENVHLWHPDDPYLHFFKTEVIHDGKVVDCFRTRFGIRLFEMRGAEGLFVNKKYIGKKLIGANRHQDYTYVGNALPNSGQWRDAKLLRQGGCNIVRAAHYPLDPAFYDACDEFGILVTTANPGWQYFNFNDPVFEERLYEDTRALVRRDRHVASMLMWETAINETPDQPPHVMRKMHEITHQEIPFPSVYTVADVKEARSAGLDMNYHGSSPTINSFNREYGDGREVDNFYSQNAKTRIKMEWGENALLQQTLVQANNLNNRYPTDKVRIGGALWCGIDHQRGYHTDPFWGGLLNGVRIPKYTYYLYQSQYDPDYKVPGVEVGPMLFVAHELTQVSPEDIVVLSNCDEVRLTWMGKDLGIQKPDQREEWKNLPHPPFVFKKVFDLHEISKFDETRRKTHEYELVAEGLIDGEVVIRKVKPYAEKSVGLKLEIAHEGLTLSADGSDFIPVRAYVISRDGAKKVLAREYVHFEVEGPAEVIGGIENNANPVLTRSMGIATALIRAETTPGKITVTAHADGLESASISFESEATTLPLLFNDQYNSESKKPKKDMLVIKANRDNSLSSDVKELQEEVQKLRLEVTSKHQDIMDLRSRLGQEQLKKE